MPDSHRSETVKTDALLQHYISLIEIEEGVGLRLIVTGVKWLKQMRYSSIICH